MARVVFVLIFGSLTLMAQTSGSHKEVIDRALFLNQTICGPIGIQARMLDTSLDRPVEPHQRVGITLNNLKPIVLERITAHFGVETPVSGAPFEMEHKVEVGARQKAFFAESFSGSNPVNYVELNSVKYADGSIWQPTSGEVCKIVPDPLRN